MKSREASSGAVAACSPQGQGAAERPLGRTETGGVGAGSPGSERALAATGRNGGEDVTGGPNQVSLCCEIDEICTTQGIKHYFSSFFSSRTLPVTPQRPQMSISNL